MRIRKQISALINVFLVIILLMGSTGITMIIHKCDSCDDFSFNAGIFLSPSIPQDNCCQNAEIQCPVHSSGTSELTCCHFKVEKLKVPNYTPSEKIIISAPLDFSTIFRAADIYPVKEKSLYSPLEINNKHGASNIIKYYCQFLA